ncbi:zinc metalloproteinase nas-6-like [Amphibalanus amphitrite]|uniref:zinc metalloproteinase nas-6-like n=1 Tax=Amphibalanus amphitrite TaxID=1232801 RepID=UPI001C91CF94|nr:zinc metalloproteinase nas-6-like [Amphibalanus amphitrite]
MRVPSRCSLLAAALVAVCGASNLTASRPPLPFDQDAVLKAAETGTVPLNTLLLAISQSPRVVDTRDSLHLPPPAPHSHFGPFGQLLERDDRPSDEEVLARSEPLTPQDFKRAQFMPLLPPPLDVDNVLNSEDHFEGDIIITPSDFVTISEDSDAIEPHKLWPDGVLHYALAPQFNRNERAVIARAVMEFERHTCLRVRPLPPGDTSRHYVNVVKGRGCYSGVGRMESTQSRSQELSLGQGCIFPGVVMHEFMHAFGFWHEQSRPDRDNHVFVHTDNIRRNMLINFKKYDWDTVATRAEPYDVGSIMHYGPYAFAVNKFRPTLTALRDTRTEMGQRKRFSKIDIRKLNRLYGCDDKDVPPPDPPGGDGDCRDDSQYCPYWARRGECGKNEKYMHEHCRRSCKRCTDGTCSDLHRLCKGWSRKKQCKENPSYMLIYCRLSCKVCSEKNVCEDMHRLCNFWARTDECEKNPTFMEMYCKASCHLC